jgi:hypothetical protein
MAVQVCFFCKTKIKSRDRVPQVLDALEYKIIEGVCSSLRNQFAKLWQQHSLEAQPTIERKR